MEEALLVFRACAYAERNRLELGDTLYLLLGNGESKVVPHSRHKILHGNY